MNEHYTKPLPSEIEISVFGPGRGECIVVHTGDDKWIIVDSCIEKTTKKPISLLYFEQIDIDPSNVELFIVSHWHDDHIRGAAEILEQCPNAVFVCSDALNGKEFFQFVTQYNRQPSDESGVSEFSRVFDILFNSPNRSLKWAIADRLLHRDQNEHITMTALSPSDQCITEAKGQFGRALVKPNETKRKAIRLEPNHVAVALWIAIDGNILLLGSDLEKYKNDRMGWNAVVLSSTRPNGKAKIVKVPHHGSNNAYCENMWRQMVDSDPYALVTPFSSGDKPLPSEGGIDNLRRHTSNIYCTGEPKGYKAQRRDSIVEKHMKDVLTDRRSIYGSMGHVRIRFQNTNAYEVTCFNGARQI